jgi:hypothetical protein
MARLILEHAQISSPALRRRPVAGHRLIPGCGLIRRTNVWRGRTPGRDCLRHLRDKELREQRRPREMRRREAGREMEPRELPKLPQARMYLKSAQWAFV